MIITAIIEGNTSFSGPRLGVEIQSFLEQEKNVMQAYIFHPNSERQIWHLILKTTTI